MSGLSSCFMQLKPPKSKLWKTINREDNWDLFEIWCQLDLFAAPFDFGFLLWRKPPPNSGQDDLEKMYGLPSGSGLAKNSTDEPYMHLFKQSRELF